MIKYLRTSAACTQCCAGRIPAGVAGVGEPSLGDEAWGVLAFGDEAVAATSLGVEGPEPSLSTGDLSPIVTIMQVG